MFPNENLYTEFKAKLIENHQYYTHRRIRTLFGLFSGAVILTVIFQTAYRIPIWGILTLLAIFIIYEYFKFKNYRKTLSLIGNSTIEISPDEVIITGKNKKDVEKFNLREISEICIKDKYGFPDENLTDIAREIAGKTLQNYLIFKSEKANRRFDFEFDSYYMIKQFNNLIEQWKKQGKRVVVVTS